MMMGNQVTTSTFMIQQLCTASLFMHDKPDWWIECYARMSINLSLKDV